MHLIVPATTILPVSISMTIQIRTSSKSCNRNQALFLSLQCLPHSLSYQEVISRPPGQHVDSKTAFHQEVLLLGLGLVADFGTRMAGLLEMGENVKTFFKTDPHEPKLIPQMDLEIISTDLAQSLIMLMRYSRGRGRLVGRGGCVVGSGLVGSRVMGGGVSLAVSAGKMYRLQVN